MRNQEHTESLRAAQLDNYIPDGWYYDDYESGTWLVVIGDKIVKDGIPSREEAIRIYRDWQP